jgi:hypothetical protein
MTDSKEIRIMDRMTFLKTVVAAGATLPCCLSATEAKETGRCEASSCQADAAAVRQFLSTFLANEERNLDRKTLEKLMTERGHACCRALIFRQDLIAQSEGDVDKLVELMGRIVGAVNCQRKGDTISLVYPVDKCVCGWSPQRAPFPDDPYCDCSAANNQLIFETVSGRKTTVQVLESPRRGGVHCRFRIQLG